jgi:glycosyltransferase involved in cell wall biosynthesis
MIDRQTETPEVSVIVPAFRASADIGVALDSIFAQTLSSHEVIVVNDGSPDTPELRRALQPYASRIVYIELAANRGAAVARNAGILRARGRYVAFLDADDRWLPTMLATQVAYLDAHPECALVYADALITGESPLAGQRFMQGAPSDGEVTLLSLIEQRCNVILSTVVVRRDIILKAGLFDEGLRRGQDADLWLRMALRGAALAYQRHVLAERRVRASGLSGDVVSELERALNVLDRFGTRHLLDAPARTALRIRTMQLVDRLEIEQGKRRILEGNFAAAQYHLSATRERPLKLRVALLALQVAPRLVRAIYVRARPATWAPALATSSR